MNRVQPGINGIAAEYVVNTDNWEDVCDAQNLVYGDVLVFKNVGNNRLNLMALNPFGRAKTHLQFLGAAELNLNQPELDHEEKS